MFRPNNRCSLARFKGNNAYAEPIWDAAVQVRCGVVELPIVMQKTPVRADSSATRGAAEEDVAQAKILFLPGVGVKIGDRVVISGFKLRISGIQPRWAVNGAHDHDEAVLEVYE